jgi:hypothetical protein
VGWCFIAAFAGAYNWFGLSLDFVTAAASGIVAGIIAIVAWQVMFALNPDPPSIKLKSFYIQLLIAHIIFGLVAYYSYLWMI